METIYRGMAISLGVFCFFFMAGCNRNNQSGYNLLRGAWKGMKSEHHVFEIRTTKKEQAQELSAGWFDGGRYFRGIKIECQMEHCKIWEGREMLMEVVVLDKNTIRVVSVSERVPFDPTAEVESLKVYKNQVFNRIENPPCDPRYECP